MFVGRRGVLVSLLAVLVSRFGVLLRLFVLAEVVMMGGLMMMMGRGVVMCGGLMMMLAGCMLRGLCHGASPPNRSIACAGRRLDMGRLRFVTTPGRGLTPSGPVFIPQIPKHEKPRP
jgi:hypothetical protein